MKGYWIVRCIYHNQEAFELYAEAATAIVNKNGGKFLVRGGKQVNKESAKLERTVLVEFPTYQVAQSVYDGEEYQNAIKHIKDCSFRDFVISEGL
tara:strand:- start:265 stop:549 length:285 start_codon:yes stop_codon:yes gene_type:complete